MVHEMNFLLLYNYSLDLYINNRRNDSQMISSRGYTSLYLNINNLD